MARADELTMDDAERIAAYMVPVLKEALREDFHKVRNEANAATLAHEVRALARHEELVKEHAQIVRRVTALEVFKWRIALTWGGIVAVVTIAYHLCKDVVFGGKLK